MEKLFDTMFHAFGEGATVLSPVVRKTDEHSRPVITYAREEALRNIKQVLRLRAQKAMIPYRFRMAWR